MVKKMANYENGLDTKAKIIDTCKVLFYNKGYNKTTFKDIGVHADVNQGLIVYYYKNKNILANTIFQDIMTDMMKSIEEIYSNEDLLTQYFISDFWYFRLLYDDAYFRNFIATCCQNGSLKKQTEFFDTEYQKYYDGIISFFEDGYIVDMSLKEGLLTVFEGMKDNYSAYVCQNYKRMTTDVATTNYITIYCHLMDIPKEIYGSKMLNAELLSNQVEVSIKNFSFKVEHVHHSQMKWNEE